MTNEKGTRAEKRSLFNLLVNLPNQLIELVKSEFEQLKAELLRKLKHAGIGVGFLAVAATFAFFAAAVLTTAAILGLAVILPGWLAALIVAALLLVIVTVFVLLGVNQFKKSGAEPAETIDSVRKDVRVITGNTKRAKP